MVRGLKLFAEYFAGYEDRYVLIGGAACDIWLSKAEFRPRATKDLDLVLVIEAVDSAFVARFWTFVREGGYTRSEHAGPNGQDYYKNRMKSSSLGKRLSIRKWLKNVGQPRSGQGMEELDA